MVRLDPAAIRQFAAQLQPGAIIRGHNAVAEKIKRHVLICSNAQRSLAFLINTQPSAFIQRQPDLSRRQVAMLQAHHTFMAHDSFIACHDTVALPPFPELAALMLGGQVSHLGWLAQSLWPDLIKAADGSRLIAERDTAAIRQAFATGQ